MRSIKLSYLLYLLTYLLSGIGLGLGDCFDLGLDNYV